MQLKKIIGIQLLFSLFFFAACDNSPKDQQSDDIEIISESDRQAFIEKKEEMEAKLDAYITKIDAQLETAEETSKEKLEMAKSEAEKMKQSLLKEYAEFTEESSEKWMIFKDEIENFVSNAEDDLAELTEDESK